MLQLERVTKVYKIGTFGGKTLTAVRDVSFDLRPGEVVSLIGESGSGKSTVGKMILRLTPVTDGSISFEGTDVSTLERRRLKGYHGNVQGVFQDPFSSYNPIFKIDRVLSMIRGAYLSGMSGSDWSRKLDASLHAVSLEPEAVLGKYPHQLSGGQLQRLLIARALLLDIKYLVADEIISMLDASTRIDVLNLLGELKARGPRRPLHHARPLARQLHQRADRDPAPRERRRDGGDREGLRESDAPLHQAADRLSAPPAQEMGAGRAGGGGCAGRAGDP